MVSILQSFTEANILLIHRKKYSLRTNKAAENRGRISADAVEKNLKANFLISWSIPTDKSY